MKKFIIVFLSLFIIFLFIFSSMYKKNKVENINKYIVEIFNGFDVQEENIDSIVTNWGMQYQKSTLCSDDELFCILDNYEEFEDAVKEIEENRYSIFGNENQENFEFFSDNDDLVDGFEYNYNKTLVDKYIGVFSLELLEKDERIIKKENALYVRYNDFSFNDYGFDSFSYEHFYREIRRELLENFETFSQRQAKNRFKSIGYEKEGNDVVYKIFDAETNQTVKVRVTFNTIFVTNIKME